MKVSLVNPQIFSIPGFSQLAVLWEREKLSPLPLVSLLLHPNAAHDTIWELLAILPTWMFVLVC
jgi:hypothetical protein